MDRESVGVTEMLDDVTRTTRAFPAMRGRVADLQAKVREHTTRRLTPEELASALREDGLDARVDGTAPGGRELVRVDDGDVGLLFDADDGSLTIVDVRRDTDAPLDE
jgi:hypothetical protein